MRLLIDIGNSRIKAGMSARRVITCLTPLAWRERGPDVLWEGLFDSLATPSQVVVANVAGTALAESLRSYVARRWQLIPVFAQVYEEFAGMRTCYEQPGQLGIDRWLAALAGWHLAGGATGVIDAGTALTVDVVAPRGEHLGGLIAPGLSLMARSLTQGTAQLEIDVVHKVDRFATNTKAAISLGCREAFAGLLLRTAARWHVEIGAAPQRFSTGGEAGLVVELSPFPVTEVPDLVLQGLDIVAEQGG